MSYQKKRPSEFSQQNNALMLSKFPANISHQNKIQYTSFPTDFYQILPPPSSSNNNKKKSFPLEHTFHPFSPGTFNLFFDLHLWTFRFQYPCSSQLQCCDSLMKFGHQGIFSALEHQGRCGRWFSVWKFIRIRKTYMYIYIYSYMYIWVKLLRDLLATQRLNQNIDVQPLIPKSWWIWGSKSDVSKSSSFGDPHIWSISLPSFRKIQFQK